MIFQRFGYCSKTMVAVATAVQNCPRGKLDGFRKFRGGKTAVQNCPRGKLDSFRKFRGVN
jgi:hypothetical protein